MSLLDKTKEICRLYDIWPSRSKGQNFLINEVVYDKIVDAANLGENDTVLEVGPGLGFLTAKLVQKAGKVVAVELDDKLAAYLNDAISGGDVDNIKIINENVLDVDLKSLSDDFSGRKYKIVANLPYNITSVFLRKFLEGENKPSELVLMLQKEVAERICAKPGDMSLLALSIQLYADPEILFKVPRADFYPSPEVDSAVIRIKIKDDQPKIEEDKFFRLAKIGFSAKRKMLKNNLAGGLRIPASEIESKLVSVGLDAKVRAEDLSLEDWSKLSKIFF